jgi:anion-transporting  ArsA/GET3 family ATPase
VYAQISGSLAGAQEYAAMAELHEFDRRGEFEMIVVDTPPTAHALDFLDAPEKLSNAIDSPAIEWFRKLRGHQGSGWSVVGKTGSYVLKRLSRFVGSQFLEDLAVFFTEFNDILGGFRQRAEETFSLLRQDKVGFVLVSSPEPMAIREALYFHQRLVTSQMPLAGFVVNKVHTDRPLAGDEKAVEAQIEAVPAVRELDLAPEALAAAAAALLDSHADLQRLAHADREAIGRLRDAGGDDAPLVEVPFFKEDIYDVERLGALGRFLVEPA